MALVLALLSAAFYGSADFLGGLAARRVAALAATVLAQAFGLVLVALALPLFPMERPPASGALWAVGAGLTGGVGVALLYYGLAVGRVSVVAPVTAVCAITIPVLVAIGLGERPGPLALTGIAVAIASVGLISRHDDPAGKAQGHDRSLVIALASGVAFALCILGLRAVQGEGDAVLVWGNLLAGACTLLPALQGPAPGAVDVGILLFLGVFQLGLAYALFSRGLREVPAVEASLLVLLEPVLSPIWAFLLAGEQPGPWALTGGAVILAATVWRTLQGLRTGGAPASA
ncbi:MAG: DMT family transporter [Myxococcaceae bacterium]|nr:DMT family transporter [Myxococcaceae bacterium]